MKGLKKKRGLIIEHDAFKVEIINYVAAEYFHRRQYDYCEMIAAPLSLC